jgi:hypothetical protein
MSTRKIVYLRQTESHRSHGVVSQRILERTVDGVPEALNGTGLRRVGSNPHSPRLVQIDRPTNPLREILAN